MMLSSVSLALLKRSDQLEAGTPQACLQQSMLDLAYAVTSATAAFFTLAQCAVYILTYPIFGHPDGLRESYQQLLKLLEGSFFAIIAIFKSLNENTTYLLEKQTAVGLFSWDRMMRMAEDHRSQALRALAELKNLSDQLHQKFSLSHLSQEVSETEKTQWKNILLAYAEHEHTYQDHQRCAVEAARLAKIEMVIEPPPKSLANKIKALDAFWPMQTHLLIAEQILEELKNFAEVSSEDLLLQAQQVLRLKKKIENAPQLIAKIQSYIAEAKALYDKYREHSAGHLSVVPWTGDEKLEQASATFARQQDRIEVLFSRCARGLNEELHKLAQHQNYPHLCWIKKSYDILVETNLTKSTEILDFSLLQQLASVQENKIPQFFYAYYQQPTDLPSDIWQMMNLSLNDLLSLRRTSRLMRARAEEVLKKLLGLEILLTLSPTVIEELRNIKKEMAAMKVRIPPAWLASNRSPLLSFLRHLKTFSRDDFIHFAKVVRGKNPTPGLSSFLLRSSAQHPPLEDLLIDEAQEALKSDDLSWSEVLLSRGVTASLVIKNFYSRTYILLNFSVDALLLLKKYNYRDSMHENIDLVHWAVYAERIDILRTLKDRGYSLEEADPRGMLPLEIAQLLSKKAVVQFLLSCGVKPGKFGVYASSVEYCFATIDEIKNNSH